MSLTPGVLLGRDSLGTITGVAPQRARTFVDAGNKGKAGVAA